MPRERGVCPWGCGREVALAGGWPMPHHVSPLPSAPACHPPVEWRVPGYTYDSGVLVPQSAPSPEPTSKDPEPLPCEHVACGRPQSGPGHPRRGWVKVHWSQTGEDDIWFCSNRCAGAALTSAATPTEPVAPQPYHKALAALNAMAGTHLTVMTATPARVAQALEIATMDLCRETGTRAREDARDRPTTVSLLAELGEPANEESA